MGDTTIATLAEAIHRLRVDVDRLDRATGDFSQGVKAQVLASRAAAEARIARDAALNAYFDLNEKTRRGGR